MTESGLHILSRRPKIPWGWRNASGDDVVLIAEYGGGRPRGARGGPWPDGEPASWAKE